MKKLLIIMILLLSLALGACAAEEPEAVEVMTLKGPTGVGMAVMIDEAANGGSPWLFTLAGAPEEIVAGLSGGNTAIAALPTNLASKLYAKTEGDIMIIAITTLGSLYLLENPGDNEPITNLEQLRGRTIYATGQGANPQYILEYLLENAGLSIGGDVFVEYKSEHAELAALLAAGEVDLALLPEPFVTSALLKNEQLRQCFDLNELWQEAAGSGLAMSCVAARRSFVEQNPELVAQFLAELEDSINLALSDVPAVAALCETYGVIASAAVAEQAIPRCSLVFISGEQMQPALADYLQMLLQADASAVGGALPNADFYYQE